MDKTIRQSATLKVFALIVALVAGMAFACLPNSDAYAATGADSSQKNLVAQGTLTTQASSIPAPVNKKTMYEVYSTYFFFNPGSNYQAWYTLHLQYRIAKKGAKWKNTDNLYYFQDYTIKGLRPNTKYQARLYFKSYDGKTVSYSKMVKFRTGPKKKPAVKSVKVKAVNVKKHRGTVYGAYTGLPLGKYTYYTYKLRITVTFKKAPKTYRIMINDKTFKGNKKTYTYKTKTLRRDYSSPRGKKYSVGIATYQNKYWKGYSLLWQRNRKIK